MPAEFDRILAGLYRAASGLEDWDEQWSLLVRHVGARSSVAWFGHADGTLEGLASPGIEPEAFTRYLDHYQDKDPYNISLVGRLLTSEEVIDNGAYLETEFYRDFVRTLPNPSLYFMGISLPVAGVGSIRLGFQREAGLPDFNKRDKKRLSPLLPHLPAMMAIRTTLRLLSDRSGLAHAALDEVADALICVDRDGRVLFRNRAGIALCERAGLLERDGGGRVVLARHGPLPWHAMREVAAGAPGRSVLLRDENGPTHTASLVRLDALPDGVRQPSPARGGYPVLIRLRLLSARADLAATIRGLIGLTDAEAAVAARLSDGDDVAAIAESRSVSVHTVRTQVRMILGKSGTRTLRDFVRIVGRL